jgi:hypothetical protein
MFDAVHNKLLKKSKAYRDWHKSPNFGFYNASFFLLFCLLMSGVVWLAGNPEILKSNDDSKVLGASVTPSNLAKEMERLRLEVDSLGFQEDGTYLVLVDTNKYSTVWIEYDNSYDNVYLKTPKTEWGYSHIVEVWDFVEGSDYVYKVGAKDEEGNIVYSRLYSFSK